MVITGANFRPGAQLLLGGVAGNANISIGSSTVLSSSVIMATVSVAPQAGAGPLTVDVMNADGTSTLRAGSGRSIFITASNSLAAPLQVQTIILTNPRDGVLLQQGDEVYGTALLAGTGTGVVTGEWLWDGMVSEQFTARLVGGESASLRTMHTLPTLQVGEHALAIRVTGPTLLQTKTISVVVNPSPWQEIRLLEPQPSELFLADAAPKLRWTIVPGADKYQVGFSSKPYFSSVSRWYDVRDTSWQVPDDVWSKLPPGTLYWTVRAVELSGEARRPALLRSIVRTRKDALTATTAQPKAARSGAPLLEWQPLDEPAYYRVTLSSDAEFANVIRRYLTRAASVDLRVARTKMQAGQTYYWRVEAFTADGHWLLTGPRHSFVAPPGARAARLRPEPYLVAAAGDPPAPPSLKEMIVSRSPSPNQSVADMRPQVLIGFKPASSLENLTLTVDDLDVTGMASLEGEQLSYQPFFRLQAGEHSVAVVLGSATESWTFQVADSAAPAAAAPVGTAPPAVARPTATDAEPATAQSQVPVPAVAKPGAPATAPGPHVASQIGMNTQWVSGSAADTTAINLAQQIAAASGRWKFEANGTGVANALYSPEPRHFMGHFNNYIGRTTYEHGPWGADLRFGILTPSIYSGSELVTTGSARQGVDPSVRTPAGTFGFFANTDDGAAGAGIGVNYSQRLIGAGYIAPLPSKTAEFRLMWLSARDEGTPLAAGLDQSGNPLATDQFGNPVNSTVTQAKPASGDMYGGLLRVNLSRSWVWKSEYAWSYNRADLTDPTSQRLFGRAWNSGVQGTAWKTTLNFVYRDVGPNFASPANPSLTQSSTPDRRGLDVSASRPVKLEAVDLGTVSLGYQYLQNNVRAISLPELDLNNLTGSWTKNLKSGTLLSLQVHETRTIPGKEPAAFEALPPDQQLESLADNRDLGFNATITQRLKKLSLTFGGGRDWYRDRLTTGQNTITSNLSLSADWSASRIFRLQSNVGVNYVNSDPLTVGANRVVTTLIQPMLIWQKKGLQFTPSISVSKTDSALGSGTVLADQLSTQYSGRISWQMPGRYKFSMLAFEGGQNHIHDALLGTDTYDPRILFLWTITWGYDRQAGLAR